MPIVSLIGKTLKWFINDTDLSDKNHCEYYYSIINHNIAQWLISQTLHIDVLKPLLKTSLQRIPWYVQQHSFASLNIISQVKNGTESQWNSILYL